MTMDMMLWYATEGGRKCPMCGRYAKSAELGFLGGTVMQGASVIHLDAYGHLPGFGCHKTLKKEADCDE